MIVFIFVGAITPFILVQTFSVRSDLNAPSYIPIP